MGLFKIQTTIWYDTHEQCYFNALTINGMPTGKLAELVVRKNRPKISPFDTMSASSSTSKYDRPLSLDSNSTSTYNQNHNCPYLIYSPNKDRALSENDYDWLLSFLVENDYTIDYQMTKMITNGFRNSHNMNSNASTRILCFFRDSNIQ